jgi:hypothetical protein
MKNLTAVILGTLFVAVFSLIITANAQGQKDL